MKNYFYTFFIVCFLTNPLFAQQTNNTEFKTKTLQVYQNLDKVRVPHGILLDFGMEFTNLQAFNGTLSDSTFTNSQRLSDIYKTLLMCRVRQVNTGFITPEEYATRWYLQRTSGVLVLSGQYFKYSRFADTAYPSKLNYVNNQFSDKFVNSVWQDPYEEKSLFAMAPPVQSYKGLQFKVKLPANLFLSNYPATVQNIQVDFSDGLGFRIAAFDQLLNVNYTLPNTYIWKYKITLTNGQILLSHSKMLIEKGLKTIDITANSTSNSILESNEIIVESNAITNPPPAVFDGYYKRTINSTIQYLGYNASATIYIRYAPGGTTIRKPLIVAEGFDDGIILKPDQEAGSNNIQQFIDKINFSGSGLQTETDTFDIIYVDWNNGVTFLQRNAYVLEEVIKWVNAQKALAGSTTQNVVLGQSMGGLIARYALKDMEDRGENHDTRLYVSHDAPHLGSNTPVSVQLSARHLRNLYVNTPIPFAVGEIIVPLIYDFAQGFSSIINLFGGNTSVPTFVTPLQAFSLADTPAARQMNYNWVNNNFGIDNVIHDAWQTDLSSKGYPIGYPTLSKPIRNIAIANGSECGILQTENTNIMSYIKNAGKDTFLSNYIGILDAVYGVAISNPIVVIVALFPGKSFWQIDFQSKYMTTLNQNKSIYNGIIKYQKKVFWFISVTVTITNRNSPQPANVLPYDIYGGGQQTTDASQLPLSGIISNTFGFIPTASSLDIGKSITPILDFDYRKPYVGGQPPIAPKNSPFQNFVTGFVNNQPNLSNSEHISFNFRNGNWLASELDADFATNQITNCGFICAGSEISGISLVCTTANFTAPPSPATTFAWSITQGANLITLTNANSATCTVTRNAGSSGSVTLALTLSNNLCGATVITKNIHVGVPSFPSTGEITGPENVTFGQTVTYTYTGAASGYTWEINALSNDNGGPSCAWQILSGQHTSTITAQAGCIETSAVIQIKRSNACGQAIKYMITMNTDPSTGGGGPGGPDPCDPTLSVYPNPLSNNNNLVLSLIKPTPDPCDPNGLTPRTTLINQIKIYNFSGALVYSNNCNTDSITLSNLNLTPGNHVLNVFTSNGKILREVLVVQ